MNLRVALFETHIAALDIAEFAKLLPKRIPPLPAITCVEQSDDDNLGAGRLAG